MSVLLKALEKSEEEREGSAEGAPVPEGGSPPAGGGFSLSGGGGGGPSKLSSALHSAEKGQEEAARVVSGYEAGQEADAEAEEDRDMLQLRRAQARSRVRWLASFVVVILAAGGAYYAAEEFGLLDPSEQAAGQQAQQTGEAAEAEEAVEEIAVSKLEEPEYDVQQDILQAVLSVGDQQGQGQGESEDVARRIAEWTQQLLAESIEEARSRREEQIAETERVIEQQTVQQQESLKSLEERLTELVGDDGQGAVAYADPNDYMLQQLALLDAPTIEPKNNRREFVAPAGTTTADVAVAVAEPVAPDPSATAPSAAPTPPPREIAQAAVISKSTSALTKVFSDAVAKYESGNFDAAENGFRTVLASSPKDVNSMVGLAKVHSSRGNLRLAANTLLRASELQPTNPVVISELIALQGDSPQQVLSEKRLLGLLGRVSDPGLEARLQFLLGGMFARQERWFEAREVFKFAHNSDRGNPDYAYNLAVVHDFLNESSEAIKMYRMAASLAGSSVSSFDPQVATSRADELADR